MTQVVVVCQRIYSEKKVTLFLPMKFPNSLLINSVDFEIVLLPYEVIAANKS